MARLRASQPTAGRARFAVPSPSDVLSSLGIGAPGRQQQQQGDGAAGLGDDVESLRRLPLSTGTGGCKVAARRGSGASGGITGVVTLRTGLLVAYLAALHLSLMVSMNNTTHCHHDAIVHGLPGH